MNFAETMIIAGRSLRANKLRSALTTVGIVIGVTAVIVLVGLGDGMKAGFSKSFGALATAVVVSKIEGEVPGSGKPRALKDGDVQALRDRAPALASVTPQLVGTGNIHNGPGAPFRGQITGSTTDFLTVSNRQIVLGSMFTEADLKSAARVTLIGPEVVANLFNGDAAAAYGKTVRISRSNFKVIGVLKSDGGSDNVALMPLSTARAYLLGGNKTISGLVAKATTIADVPAAVEQITRVLSARHNITDPAKEDFKVTALQNQLDKINQFMTFLTLFIVAVAGISLLVGGIGVANIMLVSVTERTREIGIRKAIGARRNTILKQFLIESTVLAGLGGLMGILFGVGIVLAAARIIPTVTEDFGVPQVSIPAVTIAFAVSLAIGLIAGGYPAFRAARLQPIEALRYQ
ncbi:ABC transporter permease [Pseudonocardia spinosispora]|uniref:ABC transporter permease n=1 Tax=Pseudonocardia spinosispora TaxID=103441 RepID=UPI0004089272|nr:ABC transporter permease [Pseudonocardia spinosispora]